MRTPIIDASAQPPQRDQVWRNRRTGRLCRIARVDPDRRKVVKVHGRGIGSKVRVCTWENLVTAYELVAPAR